MIEVQATHAECWRGCCDICPTRFECR